MLREPVGHDEPLKSELSLQQAVQDLAVGARVGVVHAVIRAHDIGGSGMYAVSKRPEVELMHGLIINVGRDGLDAVVLGV
jgi:hypothetical protein